MPSYNFGLTGTPTIDRTQPVADQLAEMQKGLEAPPPPTVAQPFNMKDMLQAFLQMQQQQQQGRRTQQFEGIRPPTRHLGMSGEDITGKTGPYDSGGIDWLKNHRESTPAFDPAAAVATAQQRQGAGNLPHVAATPDLVPPSVPSLGPEWTPSALGGQEAQINPHVQNPFSDANYMFRNGGLSPNQTGTRRPGLPVISDERGPRFRAPAML